MVVPASVGVILMLIPVVVGIAVVIIRYLVRNEFQFRRLIPFFAGFGLTIIIFLFQTWLIVVKEGSTDLYMVYGSATYESPDKQAIEIDMHFAQRKCVVVNATALDLMIEPIYYEAFRFKKAPGPIPDLPPPLDIPAHTAAFLEHKPDYLPGGAPPDQIDLSNSSSKGEMKTWLHFVRQRPGDLLKATSCRTQQNDLHPRRQMSRNPSRGIVPTIETKKLPSAIHVILVSSSNAGCDATQNET